MLAVPGLSSTKVKQALVKQAENSGNSFINNVFLYLVNYYHFSEQFFRQKKMSGQKLRFFDENTGFFLGFFKQNTGLKILHKTEAKYMFFNWFKGIARRPEYCYLLKTHFTQKLYYGI